MDPLDTPTPEEAPDSNPTSPTSSQASTPHETDENPKRLPSLRSVSDPQNMNPNSTPLGTLSNARRPPPPPSSVMGGGALSGSDAMLKARSLAQARSLGKSPASNSPANSSPGRSSPVSGFPGGFPGNVRLPPGAVRPSLQNSASAPTVPKPQGLSARRGMKLSMNDMAPPAPPAGQGKPGAPGRAPDGAQANGSINVSRMDDFKKYIDAEKGWLTFEGAATITSRGVDFEGGRSFHMSLDDVAPLEVLGKGNYGTVHKVRHARAPLRFGPGLSQYKGPSGPGGSANATGEDADKGVIPDNGKYSGVVMAMKEIRLELDEAKFTTILKELVILHECVSPYIIDFYGAFFQEGAVYMCIEYMDGGSVDKLYAGGVPEEVLRRIVFATVNGLKTLKEDHNIIHRDVKPTNILVNTKGQVKICDFGVSGNLVASIAKTNIGCQSYMAPERISGGAMASGADGTYSVQSDIWSLGLTAIECALGKYPYPPEAASTIFSQLSAIVDGDPPDLPAEGYSETARKFVRSCMNKIPKNRPTYDMLLKDPWLKPLSTKNNTISEEDEEDAGDVDAAADGVRNMSLRSGEDTIVAEWVKGVLAKQKDEEGEGKKDGEGQARPALHAAPLDSASPGLGPLGGPFGGK